MILDKYCTKEWLDFVNFHSQIINLKRKEIIFQSGEETKGIYLILEGKVKVTRQSGAGGQRIIRLATKDDFIGHRGFGGNWEYTITAHCLTDCKVLLIPMNIFETLVKSNPEFAYYMVMFFAEELRVSENLATTLPMKNQVAAGVLKNLEAFGFDKTDKTKISLTLSRKDMASLVGTRYETVVRALTEFKNEGIIQLDAKNIHIIDLKRLNEYAQQ
ncbi:MAG: Crp/Fnr family transcriptional regulator [Brumimicrobium sp.]|nr:Crp/Fnr family transcriptional regulator [Brumimicrobium sp.]